MHPSNARDDAAARDLLERARDGQSRRLRALAIHLIWKAFNLKPHRTETFKLSTDPLFVEKVRDIVGLYLSPPERAVVLCVDENSQIQALDRTQPLAPPPRPSRAAHARLRASRNAQPVSPLSTRRPALSSGVAIPVIADASS